MDTSDTPVEVFCCFASEDELLLRELRRHLALLEREQLIKLWANVDIEAGAAWQMELDRHLNNAQIILLLISPDFIASDYCYSVEMNRSLERHARGEVKVIPIILRPTDWQTARFSKLWVLPKGALPVVSAGWPSRDDAFVSVVEGIRQAIQERKTLQQRQQEEEAMRQSVREQTRERLLARERQLWEEEDKRRREEQERQERLEREVQARAERLAREEQERQERLAREAHERQMAEQAEQLRREQRERERLAEEARQRQAALQAAEEEREREKNLSYRCLKFRRDELYTSASTMVIALLILLIGAGALIGVLTQRWYWAVVGVLLLALLAYFLGYRKALTPLPLGIITLASGIAASGLSLLVTSEDFFLSTLSPTLFSSTRHVTLMDQLIAGICVGALASLPTFYVMDSKPKAGKKDVFGDNLSTAFIMNVMLGAPLWLVANTFAFLFGWGFGFGAGWNVNLLYGCLLMMFAEAGVICLGYVWHRSHQANLPPEMRSLQVNEQKSS